MEATASTSLDFSARAFSTSTAAALQAGLRLSILSQARLFLASQKWTSDAYSSLAFAEKGSIFTTALLRSCLHRLEASSNSSTELLTMASEAKIEQDFGRKEGRNSRQEEAFLL